VSRLNRMIEIKLYFSVVVYVDDDILDGRIQAITKYTKALVVASRLEVNADKSNYMVML